MAEPKPSPMQIMANRIEAIGYTRDFCPSKVGKQPRPVTAVRIQHQLDSVADRLRRGAPQAEVMDDLRESEIHAQIVGERIREAMEALAQLHVEAGEPVEQGIEA